MIRKAIKRDLKKIYELGLVLDNNFIKVNNLENDIKNNSKKIMVYEDEKENEIIAFIYIDIIVDEYELIYIIVDKNFRGKSIATNLCKSTLDKNTFLEVNINNTNAISLYKNLGFKKISLREKYYNNKEDALIMKLEV